MNPNTDNNDERIAKEFFGTFYSVSSEYTQDKLRKLLGASSGATKYIQDSIPIAQRLFNFSRIVFILSILLLVVAAFFQVNASAVFLGVNISIFLLVAIFQIPYAGKILLPLYYMLFYFHYSPERFINSCEFAQDYAIPIFKSAFSFVIILGFFVVGAIFDIVLSTFKTHYKKGIFYYIEKFRIFLSFIIIGVLLFTLYEFRQELNPLTKASAIFMAFAIIASRIINQKFLYCINKNIICIQNRILKKFNECKSHIGEILSKFDKKVPKIDERWKNIPCIKNFVLLLEYFFPYISNPSGTKQNSDEMEVTPKNYSYAVLFKYASHIRWVKYSFSKIHAIVFAIVYITILSYQFSAHEKFQSVLKDASSNQETNSEQYLYWNLKGDFFSAKDLSNDTLNKIWKTEKASETYNFYLIPNVEYQKEGFYNGKISEVEFKNLENTFRPYKITRNKAKYFIYMLKSDNKDFWGYMLHSSDICGKKIFEAKKAPITLWTKEKIRNQILKNEKFIYFSSFLFMLGFIFMWRKGGDYLFAFWLGISWLTAAISLHYSEFLNTVIIDSLKGYLLANWSSYFHALSLALISYLEIFITLFNLLNVFSIPLALAFVSILSYAGRQRNFWNKLTMFVVVALLLNLPNILGLYIDTSQYSRPAITSTLNIAVTLSLVIWGIVLYKKIGDKPTNPIPTSFIVGFVLLQFATYFYFLHFYTEFSNCYTQWAMGIFALPFFIVMIYSILFINLFNLLSVENITCLLFVLLIPFAIDYCNNTTAEMITDISVIPRPEKHLLSYVLIALFLKPAWEFVNKILTILTDPISAKVKSELKHFKTQGDFGSKLKRILPHDIKERELYTVKDAQITNTKTSTQIGITPRLENWLSKRNNAINLNTIIFEWKCWFYATDLIQMKNNVNADMELNDKSVVEYLIPAKFADELQGLLFFTRENNGIVPLRKSSTTNISNICIAHTKFKK